MMKKLEMKVEKGFDLEKAVCNHGFFMMYPNHWISSSKSLRRPLRLSDGCSSVIVSISSSSTDLHHSHIHICVHNRTSLSHSDQEVIQKQVIRMLRLTNKDENDVRKFQEMHAEARNKGFGRLFRSPDLFEDIIKTVLLCNMSWNRTLEMCQYLCELQTELQSGMYKDCSGAAKVRPKKIYEYFRSCKKTTSKVNLRALGNFPSSKELAGITEEILRERCNLGFRAEYIIQLANLVENSKLKLEEFEGTLDSYEKIRDRLMKLKGIGPFAAANILMCMGDYRNIPADSETIKHLREAHGISTCNEATMKMDAKRVYDKYAPYQCLAYWFENVESYERKLGQKLSKLPPSNYQKVASSCLSSQNKKEEECKTVTTRKRKRSCTRAKS